MVKHYKNTLKNIQLIINSKHGNQNNTIFYQIAQTTAINDRQSGFYDVGKIGTLSSRK